MPTKSLLVLVWLFLGGLVLLSIESSATPAQVECWDNSCHTSGWTKKSLIGPGFTDYMCREKDCGRLGWIAGGNEGIQIYTQCIDGACFKKGWYEIDRATQELLATIQCEKNDCWTFGWSIFGAKTRSVAQCANQDCRHQGWSVQTMTGEVKVITCLAGGCFKTGWRESN